MSPRAKRQASAAAAAGFCALLGLWWALAGVVIVAICWWLYRLWRHPMGPHWACRGRRGKNAGSDQHQWGRCTSPKCKNGEVVRWGARWVRPDLRR